MSLVGAANSPSGSLISRKGTSAPDQFDTKMNKNKVPTKGTQGRYSFSPIWFFAKSRINSRAYSIRFCSPPGIRLMLLLAAMEASTSTPMTNQEVRNTCPCSFKLPICQYRCFPTSNSARGIELKKFRKFSIFFPYQLFLQS